MGQNDAPQNQPHIPQAAMPGDVPVMPVPLVTLLGQGVAGGKSYVFYRLSTPLGVFVFALDPDHAIHDGKRMAELGAAAKSGLMLASSVPPSTPLAPSNGHKEH